MSLQGLPSPLNNIEFIRKAVEFIDKRHKEIIIGIAALGVTIIMFSLIFAIVKVVSGASSRDAANKFIEADTYESPFYGIEGEDTFFVTDLIILPDLDEFNTTSDWIDLAPSRKSIPPDTSSFKESYNKIFDGITNDLLLFGFERGGDGQ